MALAFVFVGIAIVANGVTDGDIPAVVGAIAFGVAIGAVALVILQVVFTVAAGRGRNWGRIALAVTTGLAVLTQLWSADINWGLILSVASIALLFLPAANEWFRGGPKALWQT